MDNYFKYNNWPIDDTQLSMKFGILNTHRRLSFTIFFKNKPSRRCNIEIPVKQFTGQLLQESRIPSEVSF